MKSLSGAALWLAIALTLGASLVGAAAGTFGFVWPGVLEAEGGLVFVPAIAIATLLGLAVASRAFPVDPEGQTRPAQSERIYYLLGLLIVVGLVTAVVGIIAAGKYAPTSLPQCRWALTFDHGFNQCSTHVRWLRAATGNAQVGIGFGTGATAVLTGLLTRARRHHLAGR